MNEVPHPRSIWAYRLLAILNIPAFLFAIVMAFEAFIVFGVLDVTGILVRLVMVLWPVPQIVGFVAAVKAKRRGDLSTAIKILGIQFVLAGAPTAAYFAWAFQS